ncbi:DUF2570 domain-containing protein [Haemophilus influenzae]
MFSRFETAIKLTALCLILGLCGWTWFQSQKISSLKAENQAQAQTIQQQEDANKSLSLALQQERDAVIAQQERDAVIAQQERNDEIERIATENAESVNTIIKTQPCANTRLPQSVLDRLYK